jgi:hypothetical protein
MPKVVKAEPDLLVFFDDAGPNGSRAQILLHQA